MAEYDHLGRQIVTDSGHPRLGSVTGILKTVSVTKALVADGNYTGGDVLSESKSGGTAWTFAAIARENGGKGYITKVQAILETTNLTPRLEIFYYKATPTCELDDNAVHDGVVHADEANFIGSVIVPALKTRPTTGGGDSENVATPNNASNLPLEFECASDADDLIAVAVILDDEAGENAGDELIIKTTVEQY